MSGALGVLILVWVPVRRSLDVLVEGRLLQLSGLSFPACFEPATPVFSGYRHETIG